MVMVLVALLDATYAKRIVLERLQYSVFYDILCDG